MWNLVGDVLAKRVVRFCLPPLSSIAFSKVYCSSGQNPSMESSGPGNTTTRLATVERAFQNKGFKVDDKHDTSGEEKNAPIPKSLKYLLIVLGTSAALCSAYIIIKIAKPETLDPEVPIWKQYLMNMRKQIDAVTTFIQEPSRDKLLPDPVSYPYYQPPYTLILEFTDVMAHPDWTYKTGWRFKKRPALDYMLENLVGLYEIVVFTAEPGMTIFPVIDALDKKNLISYKLVRDSTHFVDGHHVKNLDRLNRDLNKVVVVDWNEESVKFHPDNRLNISRWTGNDEDMALVDLTSFLKTIAMTEIEDVREVLKYYKQFPDPLAEFRNRQRDYYEKQELPPTKRPQQSIKKYFDYLM
ncbi:unnamed protein product [Acanthoscelides obtectus]|uniref:Mitochondrial import inner membrane translocase subunit TIM50 n=2 Tax=Acanthoscelides obtectus TaxID=200917 RepID=A0A9P0PHC1_ACAOB|nr:unnamed protein product [Acanthoscelides obtectus]CAH2006666.1 unnamed protein product [Acanthoscelides obtectus]CAK1660086.1 Mitochondrial import inner membrane translocase subunit TIM50-C [Acanthoscelides obtectus]CAK1660158.1 Mitochondrial import inner membrane translocase subunit TIM50-C [Acanthoscelides obtectus]